MSFTLFLRWLIYCVKLHILRWIQIQLYMKRNRATQASKKKPYNTQQQTLTRRHNYSLNYNNMILQTSALKNALSVS